MLEATGFLSHQKGLFLGWEKIPTSTRPKHSPNCGNNPIIERKTSQASAHFILTSSNQTLERGKPTPVTLTINFNFDSLALYPHKK
jgi:hypothetical protein